MAKEKILGYQAKFPIGNNETIRVLIQKLNQEIDEWAIEELKKKAQPHAIFGQNDLEKNPYLGNILTDNNISLEITQSYMPRYEGIILTATIRQKSRTLASKHFSYRMVNDDLFAQKELGR